MAGVEISGGAIRIAGKPTQIISGTIHYFRIRPEQWRDRIAKAKMMGLNAVETYVCHNLHEPKPGQFDFAGMLDLEKRFSTKSTGPDSMRSSVPARTSAPSGRTAGCRPGSPPGPASSSAA